MKGKRTRNYAQPPVRIDIGARADAKLELKAEIPTHSAGRLVEALTDLIRPFSEARGLRADQIRLQREEVAIEIAKRARERLAVEGASVHPVPNKILVPLIEASSNEDIQDEYMIEKWSNLLASAAKDSQVEPRFVGILKELQGRQAEKFERLALNKKEQFERPLAHLVDAPALLEPIFLRRTLGDLFRDGMGPPDVGEIYATILDWIDRPGCAVIDVIIHMGDDTWSMSTSELEFLETRDAFDLEVIASLGLCNRVNYLFRTRAGHEVQVIYYHISELGVRFFFSCTNFQLEPIPG